MKPQRFLIDTTQAENWPDILKDRWPAKTGAHSTQLDLIEHEMTPEKISTVLRHYHKTGGFSISLHNPGIPIGINLNTLPKGTTITAQGDYE